MLDLDFLPDEVRKAALSAGRDLCEVRLRRGRPIRLTFVSGGDRQFSPPSNEDFSRIAASLMGHSLYAREKEISEGFLSLPKGCRAGISGIFTGVDGRIGNISDIASICIRFAREAKGCADGIMDTVIKSSGLLIVSPPGLGKTTLLRDIVRQLSEGGSNVSLMDERGEIAACAGGIPGLDVGMSTDIYAMCPKATGILMAIRAMAPDYIAVDELGAAADAAAVKEAVRSGVKIIATVHGGSLEISKMRGCVGELIDDGIFDTGILLGQARGHVKEIMRFDGGDL